MKMIDEFESHETRSSRELWSEICSSLPDVQKEAQGQGGDDATLFTDSFQPSHVGNGLQSNGMSTSSSSHSAWEPMEDSDVYIASLENRLKRIKGQCTEVTSREMLRSLSQAKKECWDRFLHDAQSSELFQEGELDQSALEHLKRWLVPEKVAISAEELEYLLLPSLSREQNSTDQSQSGPEAATQNPEEDESHTPEK
ncbi:coiled-coil domain-containing protein 32 [Coregonus clupeaformis]|uniref:coiled-coil domain-containing protein 32 n=1 Tax=Coregonus clupeaformis TaxID=59861 RepID=UPI001E1C975F|nr:coiled-coil domain-containing protein 32 [Coregonus clupeaformis]